MHSYEYADGGFTFCRVSSKTAQIAYNNGLSIVLCPCNLRPGAPWHPEGIVCKELHGDFKKVKKEFETCNCLNTETGYYVSYYVPFKEIDVFTGEAPTRETRKTTRAYDYSFGKSGAR